MYHVNVQCNEPKEQIYYNSVYPRAACNFRKSGVPRPVIGSHPVPAENPEVPQPGFEPEVMSLKLVGAL
jgi:hypothetical protein